MQRPLDEALAAAGIPATVSGRPKHLWSIQRKMEKRARPYEEIYDLMAMRVLTDTVQNCYAALGIIHSLWAPIPERFHDYVATPKSNGGGAPHGGARHRGARLTTRRNESAQKLNQLNGFRQ